VVVEKGVSGLLQKIHNTNIHINGDLTDIHPTEPNFLRERYHLPERANWRLLWPVSSGRAMGMLTVVRWLKIVSSAGVYCQLWNGAMRFEEPVAKIV